MQTRIVNDMRPGEPTDDEIWEELMGEFERDGNGPPVIDRESDTGTKERDKTEEPKQWEVRILNDDYTPGELVVGILVVVFRMDERTAFGVTQKAHNDGYAVCEVTSHDIAETRVEMVHVQAQEHEVPLRAEMVQLG